MTIVIINDHKKYNGYDNDKKVHHQLLTTPLYDNFKSDYQFVNINGRNYGDFFFKFHFNCTNMQLLLWHIHVLSHNVISNISPTVLKLCFV